MATAATRARPTSTGSAYRWVQAEAHGVDATLSAQGGVFDPMLYLHLAADDARFEQQLAAKAGRKGSGLDAPTKKVGGAATRELTLSCFFSSSSNPNCDDADAGEILRAFPRTANLALSVWLDAQHRPRKIVADWVGLSSGGSLTTDAGGFDVTAGFPLVHVELTLRDFGAAQSVTAPPVSPISPDLVIHQT